jgi:hypothetical protein
MKLCVALRQLQPLLQHPRPLPDRQSNARPTVDRRGKRLEIAVIRKRLSAGGFVQIPSQSRPAASQSGLKDGAWGRAIASDGEVWLSRQLPKLSVITFADADAVRARCA